jgi:hypothetical protein
MNDGEQDTVTATVDVAARPALVSMFVREIERDPFQAMYRKKPVGASVLGWEARLQAYFWPKPRDGLAATTERLASLLVAGQKLAEARRPWDAGTREQAVAFAKEVFDWGRVRQQKLEWSQVDQVVRAALFGERLDTAPMNSGWTKVAAFLTAHLESSGQSQAIWDSRVSWSLVRRLDRLLIASGHNRVPDWLRGIGRVPGRGGTRTDVKTILDWPDAYQRWSSHLAASQFVREVRNELNKHGKKSWTLREVEMVLFMDGY